MEYHKRCFQMRCHALGLSDSFRMQLSLPKRYSSLTKSQSLLLDWIECETPRPTWTKTWLIFNHGLAIGNFVSQSDSTFQWIINCGSITQKHCQLVSQFTIKSNLQFRLFPWLQQPRGALIASFYQQKRRIHSFWFEARSLTSCGSNMMWISLKYAPWHQESKLWYALFSFMKLLNFDLSCKAAVDQ